MIGNWVRRVFNRCRSAVPVLVERRRDRITLKQADARLDTAIAEFSRTVTSILPRMDAEKRDGQPE